MFYGINFAADFRQLFCIWYQKVVLQNVPGIIIRYHFIMLCLPITAGTPERIGINFYISIIEQRPKILFSGLC